MRAEAASAITSTFSSTEATFQETDELMDIQDEPVFYL